MSDSGTQQFKENCELHEIIEAAISRPVSLLAWKENLSHKAIAEQFGITPKTVENHVGIALRKLRESLKPYYKQIFMVCVVQLL